MSNADAVFQILWGLLLPERHLLTKFQEIWLRSFSQAFHKQYYTWMKGAYGVSEQWRKCTFDSPIKVWVGGHFEARVRHQEAGDVGEAGVDVFPHILQLFMLVLWDLHRKHEDNKFKMCFG